MLDGGRFPKGPMKGVGGRQVAVVGQRGAAGFVQQLTAVLVGLLIERCPFRIVVVGESVDVHGVGRPETSRGVGPAVALEGGVEPGRADVWSHRAVDHGRCEVRYREQLRQTGGLACSCGSLLGSRAWSDTSRGESELGLLHRSDAASRAEAAAEVCRGPSGRHRRHPCRELFVDPGRRRLEGPDQTELIWLQRVV